MKVRKGFVSNSSTASFVLLGFDASSLEFEDYEDQYQFLSEMQCDYLWGTEGGALKEDDLIIGRYISYISPDDWYDSSEQFDLDEIQKEVESFRVKCGLENQPIKLWKGMCAA